MALSTSGSSLRSLASWGLRPPNPAPSVATTKSPVNCSSKTSRVQSFIDADMTVIATTRATPTMSAPPVRAVRLGLRSAFSRASDPVMPDTADTGAPRTPTTGRAMTGPRTNTPTKMASAPTPTQARPDPPRPATRAATPPTVTDAPLSRRRLGRSTRPTATSRSAASGGMRDARNDGKTADTTVTNGPSASATTAVRVLNAVPPAGMSTPNASSMPLSAAAMNTPTARPTSEASTPRKTASSSCADSTWCRVAPTARNIAISRRRCVTTIWNVL